MADEKFDSLQFVGRHLPDHSMETDENGNAYKQELPGMYQVGFLLDGVFKPIYTMKAGKLLNQLEAARSDSSSSSSSGE